MWPERWIIRWLRPILPVYRRETAQDELARQADSNVKKSWRAAFSYLAWAAAIFICVLSFRGVYILQVWIPAIILMFMLVLRVRAITIASDTIVRDAEAQTWDLLRLLPWPMHRLVKTKYAAALTRTRRTLYRLLAVRIVLFFAVILLFNRPFGFTLPFDRLGAVALITNALYYCIDSPLNFATDNALGVTISAFAQSRDRALVYGLALGCVAAGAQILLAIGLVWLSGALSEAVYVPVVGGVIVVRYVLLHALLALATRRILM